MENQEVESTKKLNKQDFFNVADGVWGMKTVFVNLYIVSKALDSKEWVLIDAGIRGYSKKIIKVAEGIFGKDAPPSAIILTHGHFDHIGSLKKLLKYWDVPVYAHHLELPYLTGRSAYPPADPSVGGGLMSSLSWAFPRGPISLGTRVRELADSGKLPVLEDWQYIHTPGHAPGHISLFRERDRVLIAGDAFVTAKQESAFSSLTQKKHLSGPPMYFTNDWTAAEESVKELARLKPEIAATGHGVPMRGDELKQGLNALANDFQKEALPKHGRYVDDPAIMDDSGIKYLPPKPFDPVLGISIFAVAILSTIALLQRIKPRR